MDAPPVITPPARRPFARIRILVFGVIALGALISFFTGWWGHIQRQRFLETVNSLTSDDVAGIVITKRDSEGSTQISDTDGRAEFIAALRDLEHYLPNHPSYRDKAVVITFRVRGGSEYSFTADFSVDQSDKTAYLSGAGGQWKGHRFYDFLATRHFIE